MLEKINHKSAPKEVVNALISLYDKGELDDVFKNIEIKNTNTS